MTLPITYPVLAIHGVRGAVKYTLFKRLQQVDDRFARYAFADALRKDLASFVAQHFAIDIWDCAPEEKELIRPMMIAFGCAQRVRDIDYWAKQTVTAIKRDVGQAGDLIVPVCTDLRFPSECDLLRREFPGLKVLDLVRRNGPPPTDEEEKHYRKVAAMADRSLTWGDDTEERQLEIARDVAEWALRPAIRGLRADLVIIDEVPLKT